MIFYSSYFIRVPRAESEARRTASNWSLTRFPHSPTDSRQIHRISCIGSCVHFMTSTKVAFNCCGKQFAASAATATTTVTATATATCGRLQLGRCRIHKSFLLNRCILWLYSFHTHLYTHTHGHSPKHRHCFFHSIGSGA